MLNEPEIRKSLTEQGIEIFGTSRTETATFIRSEMKKYAELVKFSGAMGSRGSGLYVLVVGYNV